MKLKCKDGKVRNFQTSRYHRMDIRAAFCLDCGKYFGNHDLHILKPDFKNHVCKEEDLRKKECNNND